MQYPLPMFLIISMTILYGPAFAETAEEKGLAIAQEVDRRDSGWNNATVSLKMVLHNRQGEESTREIRLKTLEVQGDGDKSLTVFDNPRDVKGTAFLSYSHIVTPDDQWLYLPALKRVKRIASSNKSGPFMGSQFSYEDLASFEVDKYRYKYIGDATLDKKDVFIIDTYPNYKYSGYTRQVVWVDKQRYIPLKVEYYDRKNDLLKTLVFNHYKQYLNKYWRAHEQVMENHQNGKLTTLSLTEFQFGVGLTDNDFHKTNLKQIR